MKNHDVSRRNLLNSAGVSTLILLASVTPAQAWPSIGRGAGPAAGSAATDFVFVDSNASQLAGVKRVIIINYVIAFQTAATTTPPSMGSSIATVGTNVWDNPDTNLMQEITDHGLAQLKASFRAKNIEVLDEAILRNQPDYNKIIQATGFDSPINWGNSDGKAVLVGATGLRPFQSYGPEVGNIESPTPMQRGVGAALGPISAMKRYTAYSMPGWEIDLAKALDAVVVKAWQVVNFAKISADATSWSAPRNWITFGGTSMTFHQGTASSTTYNSSASSHLMIRQGGSRLSFILPTSTNRTGAAVIQNPVTYMAYPRDGDVVVVLGKPYFLGSQYYSIDGGGETGNQSMRRALLGGASRSDFTAHLSNPMEYKTDVSNAISNLMVGFVGTALGR
jgi:hypothetical protein